MSRRANSICFASWPLILVSLLGVIEITFAQTDSAPVASVQETGPATEFSVSDLEFFENKIRPLLVDHCLKCHGADPNKIRAGLSMNSRQQLLQGGDTGPAIVPGKPEESLLISAVHFDDFEMPPTGQLSGKEIELLEQWVAMGAPDTRVPDNKVVAKPIDLELGRKFWSFQPVPSAKIPQNKNDSWSLNDVDRFIQRQHQEAGLQPVDDADRYQLLRRMHLALTGLPPTEQQILSFVSSNNNLEQDIESVVDTLLESPHFGERWGRHWLDVARFAESSGGGRSLMFPEAWRYRDYVIQSFNEDKPYNQMIAEQIAGDLLPYKTQAERNVNLTATGFLALGPTNYEQQDKELLRMEVIDEQVDTVGRAFLGMTLGCARCHDHKFDPVPIEDYYALAGIFGSTVSLVDGNVSTFVTQTLATEAEQRAEKKYKQRLKQLSEKAKQLQKKIDQLGGKTTSETSNKIIKNKSLQGIVVDNLQAKLIGNWKESVIVKPFVEQGYVHDDGQPKGANQAIYSPQLETGGNYEVRLSYSPGGNRASNTLVVIDHQDGKKSIRLNQTRPAPIDGLFVSLGTFRFEADNVARVTISNQDTDGVVIADAVQFLFVNDGQTVAAKNTTPGSAGSKKSGPRNDFRSPAEKKPAKDEPDKLAANPELAKLIKEHRRISSQLADLKSNAPRPLAIAMSVKDHSKPADGHVHIRGNVRQLGDVVPRGFLRVISDRESWPKIPADSSGRLELAQWIGDQNNPLTARVYVNRIWRHLFGRGLVESADNFGEMGMRPSHPELLDYLADQFVRQGWSTKKLIRKIMLSRVYRLGTTLETRWSQIDPDNRLLWRANRRRMDAEVLRDSILFASEQLDLTPGGLTIRKITQYDLGYKFDTHRRSVYVPAFRNSMLDLFEVFDMANPNMVTGHRNTSTLPTQALFLMNSPWVMDQAKAMAKNICRQGKTEKERLRLVFLRLLGRPPSNAETQLSRKYLDSLKERDEVDRWQNLIHATMGSLDFRYIN